MNVNELKEYFQVQINRATPTTQTTIDEMIARRRNKEIIQVPQFDHDCPIQPQVNYTEEQLQHIASKVGVKQLFYITRIPGKVEILKVWEDELDELENYLEDFSFYKMSDSPLAMPEFIHKDMFKDTV